MADPKIGIILQARMNSSRLPGKVMYRLGGKPMVEHVLRRLMNCSTADELVLATTTSPEDDGLVEFAEKIDVHVFRGSETDVLDRFYRCAKEYSLDHIIRATADNPFVDPEEGEKLTTLHIDSGNDYTSAFPEFGSGFPVGVGLEIMSMAALDRSWHEGRAPNHREHVDEYIQENPDKFRIGTLKAPPGKQAPHLRLTVDTPADMKIAEELVARYQNETGDIYPGSEWLIRQLDAN